AIVAVPAFGLGRSPSSAGPLRSASRVEGGPPPGHTTLTPTGSPTILTMWWRSSLIATTACLLASYAGPVPGRSPAIDAVLTMWPPRCWVGRGRDARHPWRAPQEVGGG